eukprot:CAMPEP_0182420632 /NCGR_PEP_ID=MMETSP1167-20130531/5568_1 /TAXON_ID=2988 /ORGANISM="Mallomonas Sp, Strain CCMP3275" /LENGTH=344 /DNA_ID=CAMNT_0024596833 /DNA_START=295 /DNA_END=1329 /DNA_ORIENTATION=-
MSNSSKILSCPENLSNIICYNPTGNVKIINRDIFAVSSEFQARGPINAGASCYNGVAFGGKENDLQLWDISSKKSIWSAKNVPHDNLSLRVPIWITAITFLNSNQNNSETDTTEKNAEPTVTILTGTAYKQLRLYDVRSKRQPQFSIDIGDFSVTAILPGVTDYTVYIADVSGGLYLWDLRNKRRVSTLKGNVASIRDLQTNTSRNSIVSVGLERFARLYDITKIERENGLKSSYKLISTAGYAPNGHLLTSAYLKNRLNCCLLCDGKLPNTSHKRGRDDEEDEEENDDRVQAYRDSDEENSDELEDLEDESMDDENSEEKDVEDEGSEEGNDERDEEEIEGEM